MYILSYLSGLKLFKLDSRGFSPFKLVSGWEKLSFLFFKHCAGSIPSVTPEICDSQMKICQTGDRSKGDPKYKFSSLSHDIDMIEPRTPKLSPLSMQDRYKSICYFHELNLISKVQPHQYT